MQQQINIQLQVPLKEIHELVRLKLSLQQILNGYQGASPGDLDVPSASLQTENSDLVARDGQIDLAPIPFGDAVP